MLNMREKVKQMVKHVIGDGRDTSVWYDNWHPVLFIKPWAVIPSMTLGWARMLWCVISLFRVLGNGQKRIPLNLSP